MVYLLLGDGFEEAEALVTADLLRRADIEVQLLGLERRTVKGAHGITVAADGLLTDVAEEPEMVILPGGLGGVEHILGSEQALELVRRTEQCGGYIAAICAAPTVLAKLGMLDHRAAVCYPGMEDEMGNAEVHKGEPVVTDGRFITGEAAGAVFDFALKLVEALRGVPTAQKVRSSIYYRHSN